MSDSITLASGTLSFGDFLPDLMLFVLAGLLVGGTWSAYQHSSKLATTLLALLAVVVLAGACVGLIGVMR